MQLPSGWKAFLHDELEQDYFRQLRHFVASEYKNSICFPPVENIYQAFELCDLKDLKVVIIGQDPYHSPGQAHGLCFSVNEGVAPPPSLQNIVKELALEYESASFKVCLSDWAKQGVLLLNSVLTVRQNEPGSHANKGWEKFTDAVIRKISTEKKHVVFLLWGAYARKKVKLIDPAKHLILESGHPSPLSANRGLWFGNNHFTLANAYLNEMGLDAIKWIKE